MQDKQSVSNLKPISARKRSLKDIPLEPTRNGALKRVLIRHEEVQTSLMFLNEVYVSPSEQVGLHVHLDMEEVFYFLEGEGIMQMNEEILEVKAGDRIVVPAHISHMIENTSDKEMKFVCFGVKVIETKQ